VSKVSQPRSMCSNIPCTRRTPPIFDILGISAATRRFPPNLNPGTSHTQCHPPIPCPSPTVYMCMHHTLTTQTLVADRRDILRYSHPTLRRVQDVEIRKLLGVILARVRKQEVNTNAPTIHPSPLITPKITNSYSHALPATFIFLSRFVGT
jgi:hypothetical protein